MQAIQKKRNKLIINYTNILKSKIQSADFEYFKPFKCQGC